MTNIRVDLDTVRRYRNTSEYTTVNRATLSYGELSIEKVSDGSLTAVLRDFHEENPQINAQVEVWRGNTLCFVTCPLFQWLGLDSGGNKVDKRPEQLKGGQDD